MTGRAYSRFDRMLIDAQNALGTVFGAAAAERPNPAGEAPDLDLMKRWLAESYRAVAPKKLGALLPADD